MKEEGDLRSRTKDFALRIIRMFAQLPKSTVAQVLGKQVLRSGTSVGANYRLLPSSFSASARRPESLTQSDNR